MTMVAKWLRRAKTLVRRGRVKDEIQRELEFHIQMETAERERRGASSAEARRTALRDFGGVSAVREAVHDTRGLTLWDSLSQDIRYTVRTLRRWPGYTTATILTLALGIGANTAVFSVINAAMLTPLPYPEPHRLVRVSLDRGGEYRYFPGAGLLDLRAQSQTMDVASVYTYNEQGADLVGPAGAERIPVTQVSANYFQVLGVTPLAGRVFSSSEERPDAKVVIVGERIWRQYLDASHAAIGRTLMLNGAPYQVIGVLPASFEDPLQPQLELWQPEDLQPGGDNDWDNNRLSAIARLRPGSTIDAAQAETQALVARQAANYGTTVATSARVMPLQDDMVGAAGPMLYALMAAVGLLLLLACVNVATLMLARAAARTHEITVRAALGSARWRIVRQLLTESLILSLAGGVAGLIMARMVTGGLLAAAPVAVLQPEAAALDRAVFFYCFGIALVAGLAFGIAPAIHASRPSLEAALREGGRSGGASRKQTRTWKVLVVCQVAVALVLLVGAGLLLRSLQRLKDLDLGIQPANVMTFQVNLPGGRYPDATQRLAFYASLHERLSALPNVLAVGSTSRLPSMGTFQSWGARHPGAPRLHLAEQRIVDGRYFQAVGIPIQSGRAFDAQDTAAAERRIVVSRSLADSMFPGVDPLGRQLQIANFRATVIGVVGDVALTVRGLRAPTVYHAHSQFAARNWALTQVVAMRTPEPALIPTIREQLRAIDPALVLHQPRPLADVIGRGQARERFSLQLIGAFAGLALVLAAVGLYGVLAYSVASREREIGIRMALGARASSVRRMFLGMAAKLAAAGLIGGALGALALTQGLRSLVFGVSLYDPVAFIGAAVMLACVAAAAGWIPARAASRVDPLNVLGR